MQPTREQILRRFKLRTTFSRSAILELFMGHSYALSHAKIEQSLPSRLDRVTVYRTIKTFLEKGVIHKILDDTGKLRYALCGERCSTSRHRHHHVHFKCNQCGKTRCLEDTDIPNIELPYGYRMATADFLVQGACANCQ